jgi:hypothetical protein
MGGRGGKKRRSASRAMIQKKWSEMSKGYRGIAGGAEFGGGGDQSCGCG